MSKELTVILKDSERTYKQKFLVYADINLSIEDPVMQECLASARKNFEGEPEDIQIRTVMVLR